MFNKIIVIGAGMMGSSLIWAIKDKNLAQEVKALIRNEKQILQLAEKDIVATTDYNEVRNADLVIIAANLGSYEKIILELNKVVTENTLLSEIGSVKQYPEKLVKELYRYPENFIATHPIAGSEKSGLGEVIEDLYCGKKLFITTAQSEKVEIIADFWRSIGMDIEYLSAKEHDRIYAEISHFVQLIAFDIKEYLGAEKLAQLRNSQDEPLLKTLRLCDSSLAMWQEIFRYNKDELESLKARFIEVRKDVNLSDLEKLQNKFKGYKQELNQVEHDPEQVVIALLYYYLKTIGNSKSINFSGSGFADFIQYFLHYKPS